MATPTTSHCYKIGTEYPCGYGIIIVNTFENSDYERRGAEVEKEDLRSLFKNLRLKLILYTNLSAKEIIQNLTDISKNNDLFDHSVLVVAISSHGSATGLYGAEIPGEESNLVSHKEISSIFSSGNCSLLVGKPKVFIFNACRRYADNVDDESSDRQFGVSFSQEQIFTDEQCLKESKRGTLNSDIFNIYSCLEGFVSLRSSKRGSLFISTLCEVWKEFGNSKSLADIVTHVNRRLIERCAVSNDENEGCDWSQCCFCDSTLTSELRLGRSNEESIEIDSRPYLRKKGKEGQRCQKRNSFRNDKYDKHHGNRRTVKPSSKDVIKIQSQFNSLPSEEAEIQETELQSLSIHSKQEIEILSPSDSTMLPQIKNPPAFNPPVDLISKPPPMDILPASKCTEFLLCGTAFDEVNTVFIADGVNARVWCCDVTHDSFPGFIYDPIFDAQIPYAVVADDNFIIVTCGTTLLAFDAGTFVKVEKYENKLGNFSGIDINWNKVYAASNFLTFAIYTGSYSLDMKEIPMCLDGSNLKHDLHLLDLKVSLSSIILLFNNTTNPLCVFNKEGIFLNVILQTPVVCSYRFFTMDHFNGTILLGEETGGHILIIDLDKQVWTKYAYPQLIGHKLGGLSLLAPNLLFVAVNTDKIPGDLSKQCLMLNLEIS
ncbi:Caspase-9-like isoform X3 [Oopsacas minuta]|uniref:Caspase-9-like isoform X3 n=1 Tax=Oopsacas minuta TaxID=111878 RepID=A0AAV7K7L2_9METZ|nr:Caspase-9-like isoform X3 [Oopsacas minuta]